MASSKAPLNTAQGNQSIPVQKPNPTQNPNPVAQQTNNIKGSIPVAANQFGNLPNLGNNKPAPNLASPQGTGNVGQPQNTSPTQPSGNSLAGSQNQASPQLSNKGPQQQATNPFSSPQQNTYPTQGYQQQQSGSPLPNKGGPTQNMYPTQGYQQQQSGSPLPNKGGPPSQQGNNAFGSANNSPTKDQGKPGIDHQPGQQSVPGRSSYQPEQGSAGVYNPYVDLEIGKSEEEVIQKLKSENTKHRKELKCISDDLTMLLDQHKKKKNEKAQPVKEIASNVNMSEEALRSELKNAQKQLAMYQKDIVTIKGEYEAKASLEKFENLQEVLRQKEAKIQELTAQKKKLEKEAREKERKLDVAYQETDNNTKLISLDEEVRLQRDKVKEAERKRDMQVKMAAKRKEHTDKLLKELEELKHQFAQVQSKTGYDPSKDPRPTHTNHPTNQNRSSHEPEVRPKKIPISQHAEVEEELECNQENFEKLRKELKVLQKADGTKGRKLEKEVETLNDEHDELSKKMQIEEQKIAEKQKEIAILKSKTKDLSRLVRHYALAPLVKEEVQPKERDPIPEHRYMPRKPQPAQPIIESVKQNFQAKGYRKDDIGKTVASEKEGENFTDKELVGKSKVKIIAIDIWYDDEKIIGIQAVYEDQDKEIIEGGPHVFNPEGCKMITFETLEEDYVKSISGFMSRDGSVIECLIFRTFRGEVMKVNKPSKDGKLFTFDINEFEYPAVLYGSLKDDGVCGKLVRLGVLILPDPIEEKIDNQEKKEENKEENKPEDPSSHGEAGNFMFEPAPQVRTDNHRHTHALHRQTSNDVDHNSPTSQHANLTQNLNPTPGNQPNNQYPVNQPNNQISNNQPSNRPLGNQPNNQAPVNQPYNQAPGNLPNNQAPINQPNSQIPSNQPSNRPLGNQPNNQAPINQPNSQIPSNQPSNRPIGNQPNNQAPVNQPNSQALGNQPSNQTFPTQQKVPGK